MAEKTKYFDRLISKDGLRKFDTTLFSNDGGKYSPSIRRLRQHYFHNIKSFPNKVFSSIDALTTSFKCDDCQKHDGLFQCYHCNQRLCIRCCNKHYKKVANELESINELRHCLLTKIFHIKIDFEKQKNETIKQSHQWRIDTINTINKAHTLIIQTIHNEYEILDKEFELFVDKEMSVINQNQTQCIKIKKANLSSLLSSPTTTGDSTKSMDIEKQRIETFNKRIDDLGKFSFQVKLPKFNIDDTLRVESCFGNIRRTTSAIWQNEDFINDRPSTEVSKTEASPIENGIHENAQLKHEQNGSLENHDEIPHRHNTHMPAYRIRRRTTPLPLQSPSSLNPKSSSNDHPWLYYRTNSTPSFIS